MIQRITWKSSFGIIFLGNRISVTQKNVFGIIFAITSDWSVQDAISWFTADCLQLIDVSAGGFQQKKCQGIEHPIRVFQNKKNLTSLRNINTVLLLNEVSVKRCEMWNEVSEIRPKIFGAFLAGRKVLPPNFTRYFTSDISNFKSNFTKNQEPRKGGFSKGGFCRVQCHAQGDKNYPGGIGPSSTVGTQSATAKSGVHFCKNPLLKTPLTCFLNVENFNFDWNFACESHSLRPLLFGIIERGVPQGYVRARVSSTTLCSVHFLRTFLCIFCIKKGIWYVSNLAQMHIWYVSKPLQRTSAGKRQP